jgi:hypothetical protein
MLARTAALLLLLAASGAFAAEPPVEFNREIRPLLAKKCFACHGPDEAHREAGLRLDLEDGAKAKLESGVTAIVPGKTAASELVRRITATDPSEHMPPAETGIELTPDQIDLFKRWIAEGASYAPHWAFIKPGRPGIPTIPAEATAQAAGPIDNFIAARLVEAGLAPSPRADRYALARRASLDLRGLPPTPDEAAAFVHDASPDAYERLVDRLLADPAFGERWARMWLDQARYADSRGYGSDPLRPNIWRYRDWVIDAFNRDLSYDQFTIDQIAGDLVPGATLDQRVATAFHRNTMTNTEGGTDDEEFRVAAVKDRADTTMQVWMGITLGCAKCHSHKYDPVSHKEYYQFYAIFNQTADSDKGDDAPFIPAATQEYEREVARIDSQIAALRNEYEAHSPELAAEQARWEASLRTSAAWQNLSPVEMKSTGGATFKLQADGSVLVSGDPADKESYQLTVENELEGITALRIEALPDPSLPAGGSGRSMSGDFRLTGLNVQRLESGGRQRPDGVLPESALNEAQHDREADASRSPSPSPNARFVRIELPGDDKILSLAEVQVFAGDKNIAQQGKATQSSVAFEGPAQLAIDGNTDGRYYESKSVTHTASGANPWWEVDLGEGRPIDRVVVWNRTDGAILIGGRLAGYKVLLLDAERNVLWQKSPEKVPSPSSELSVSGLGSVELAGATTDFNAAGLDAAGLVKATKDAKAAWSASPKPTEPHWLVISLAAPLAKRGPARLMLKLDFAGPEPKQSLGRFRLSATADKALLDRLSVPADVLAIVDTPPGNRMAEQNARLAAHYRTLAPALKGIRDKIAALEKSKPPMPTVPIMQELADAQERKTYIQLKGNFLTKGDEVSAALPGAWHKLEGELLEGTGQPDRLALARWLVHPDNPLTARVAVNRFWAQLFGAGIVETEEDFGIQGELPSHPELLDWLAVEFAGHWDIKRFLRTVASSHTYCQSAKVAPEQLAKDPRNRLLSRGPRFRLEAEMVRDQALAVSGLVSRKLRGSSVFPPQPDGLWQAAFNGERTWKTSPGEDRYRRGLYTFWRRTVPYPSMTTFDAPSRETCSLRRFRTNTPLQAFVTMNDPAYVEASQALARRMMAEGGPSPAERAALGLSLCLVRPPNEAQVAALVELYEEELAHYRADPAAAAKLAQEPLGPLPAGMDPAEAAAWTVVANVLLNLDGVLMRG